MSLFRRYTTIQDHTPCKAPSTEIVKRDRTCNCCGREVPWGLPEHDLFRCVSHLKDRIEILEKEKFNVRSWVESLSNSINTKNLVLRGLQDRVTELESTTIKSKAKKSSPNGNKTEG